MVDNVEETTQRFVAGMTGYHKTTGVCKVETSATFREPHLWSANTTEIYDNESG